MKRRIGLLLLVMLLMTMVLAACSSAPKIDWQLKISGAVSKPLTLGYQDLVKREQVELDDILMEKSQGPDEITTWEGPSLAGILEEAGAFANAVTIVCTASDGYAKEIPISDLEGAIIGLKLNGEWTTGDKGPIRIVVPSLPASYWLFQLVEIEVVE